MLSPISCRTPLLLAVAGLVAVFGGCSVGSPGGGFVKSILGKGNQSAPELFASDGCPESTVCGLSEAKPRIRLTVGDYEQREPITIPGAAKPIMGRVLTPAEPTSIRHLSWEECQRLARDSAPLAGALERQANWLQQNSQWTLAEALLIQANFERSQQQRLAEETFLNLANVYAQTNVVDQSFAMLENLEKVLVEFREAGVPVEFPPSRLSRRRLTVEETNAELAYNQQRLQAALESILNLEISGLPIWTTMPGASFVQPSDENAAVELAFSQRGDLLALQAMTIDCEGVSLESLRSLGSAGGSPLVSARVPMPTAAWWMCRLKREIERLEKLEKGQLRKQLQTLAAAKREEIRAEVRDAWYATQHHRKTLELQVQQRQLLRDEIAVGNPTGQAINVTTYLENAAQEITLTSEIIKTLFEIQQADSQLRHVLGANSLELHGQ